MAKRQITRIEAAAAKPRVTHIAVYCRVSTALDSQLPSLQAQRSHYKEAVAGRDGWELVDIYYEEGVTGTKKEVRPELNRMLSDCRKGKIDLILTKSISRFARNTADCLQMVRSLTDLGVNLVFEKEGIDTRRMGSEFLLTVLSSLAEEESKSISKNVKWTVQNKFRNGTYRYSRAPYGYDLSGGTFTVNPREAAVVRWIYDRILEGKGTSLIAEELNRMEIPTKQENLGRGKALWHSKTVSDIVTNVVYTGDILMQKTFSDSRLCRHSNFGEENQYYLECHHEAVIDRETFELAGAAIRQRARECGIFRAEGAGRHKDVHLNRYCFTGKLLCGNCGEKLRRLTQYTKEGKIYHWACTGHLRDSAACSLKRIKEANIQNAFVTMLNKLKYAPFLLDWYIERTGRQEGNLQRDRLEELQRKSELNTQKRHRLALLLSKRCVEPVFYEQEMAKLGAEAAAIRDAKIKLMDAEVETQAARELRLYVNSFAGERFEPAAFEKLVDKVIVGSGTRFTFCFSCGLNLTEDLAKC